MRVEGRRREEREEEGREVEGRGGKERRGKGRRGGGRGEERAEGTKGERRCLDTTTYCSSYSG